MNPNETPFPPPRPLSLRPLPFPFTPHFPFTPPLPPPLPFPLQLVRPRPPPPTLRYLHNHYNVHLLCDVDGSDVITEISEDDMLIVQNHEIPTVPPYNTFIYNHFALLTEPPLPSRIQEELDPGQDHEVHHYLHMHYHHFGEGYDGWYDDTRYFRNHVPPDQLLIHIENRFPQHRVVHIHKQVHFDGDERIPTEWCDSAKDSREGMVMRKRMMMMMKRMMRKRMVREGMMMRMMMKRMMKRMMREGMVREGMMMRKRMMMTDDPEIIVKI